MKILKVPKDKKPSARLKRLTVNDLQDPFLKECLTEMFNRVNAPLTININKDKWYYKYEWTEEQESDFKKWRVRKLKGRINPEHTASMFLLNWGWKTNYKEQKV